MSDINEKLMKAFESINEQMEAHLIESVISLFHQGVLKHYVRELRQTIDESNFKMSIQAASGVTFEGREKLVELEGKIQTLESELERLRKENLAMRNCENCFHFDVLNECNLNSISCIKLNKWEIKR